MMGQTWQQTGKTQGKQETRGSRGIQTQKGGQEQDIVPDYKAQGPAPQGLTSSLEALLPESFTTFPDSATSQGTRV